MFYVRGFYTVYQHQRCLGLTNAAIECSQHTWLIPLPYRQHCQLPRLNMSLLRRLCSVASPKLGPLSPTGGRMLLLQTALHGKPLGGAMRDRCVLPLMPVAMRSQGTDLSHYFRAKYKYIGTVENLRLRTSTSYAPYVTSPLLEQDSTPPRHHYFHSSHYPLPPPMISDAFSNFCSSLVLLLAILFPCLLLSSGTFWSLNQVCLILRSSAVC